MSISMRAMIAASAIGYCLTFTTNALADGTVWLPSPGTGSFSVSYVSQDADNLWVGNDGPRPIPFKGLKQKSYLLNGSYGISDSVGLDVAVGRSKVSPQHGMPIPKSQSGITDLEVGLTWRFQDEIISDGPSMAVRLGGILAGNYDTGGRGPAEEDIKDKDNLVDLVGAGPTAIGDGGSGIELSGIIGKALNSRLAVSAELGIVNRSNSVPRETFINLDGHLFASNNLVLSGQYHIQKSSGDIDIGPPPGPGAHGTYWERFPEVKEDISQISLSGTLLLGKVDLGLHWFKVLDGRNTAEFSAFGGTATFNFGN